MGKKPQSLMIPIYSTTVFYDTLSITDTLLVIITIVITIHIVTDAATAIYSATPTVTWWTLVVF